MKREKYFEIIDTNLVMKAFVACLFLIGCFSCSVTKYEEGEYVYKDFPDVQMYYDSTGNATIDQVQQYTFDYNREKHATQQGECIWLKVEIEAKKKEIYFLEVYNQRLKELDLYQKDSLGKYVVVDEGGIFQKKRKYALHYPVFELPITQKKETIYLRYVSSSYLGVNMGYQTGSVFLKQITARYFLLGGVYLTVFFLMFYNLIFFFSIRQNIYLYYILYVFLAALNISQVDLILSNYLWKDYPSFYLNLEWFAHPLFFGSLVLYFFKFFQLKWFSNRYLTIMTCTTIFVILLHVLRFVVLITSIDAQFLHLQSVCNLLELFILYFILYYTFKVKNKSKWVFIIGYGSLLIGITLSALLVEGVRIVGDFWTFYGMYIFIIIDAIMFSFALAARLTEQRMEKITALEKKNELNKALVIQQEKNEKLLQKVNLELEGKVRERTAELENAKEEIEQQSDQIQEMNKKLYSENFKLEQELKEKEKQRALAVQMSKEEFFEVFYSSRKCLDFLAQKKWKKNVFSCTKCKHSNCAIIPETLSRKCTKCKHIESPTANTIFHGVKFDLTKAFYLVYLVNSKREKLDVKKNASELELNVKTCTRFKQKVLDKQDLCLQEKRIIKSWEDLIF